MTRSLLISALLLTVATAQDTTPQAAPRKPVIRFDATTLIVPAGTWQLSELVDKSAEFLKWTVMASDETLDAAGQIKLRAPLHLDKPSGEEVLSEFLFARGLVIVPRNAERRLYHVVQLDSKRGRDILRGAPRRPVAKVLEQPNLKQPVKTIVELRHMTCGEAVNCVRPLTAVPSSCGVPICMGTGADGRSVTVIGIQSEVAGIIDAVQQMDRLTGKKRAKGDVGQRSTN